jgi:hypothetical protein
LIHRVANDEHGALRLLKEIADYNTSDAGFALNLVRARGNEINCLLQ